MNDRPRGQQPKVAEGLCPSCKYMKLVTNDRGSRFYACERSRVDPAFARYPRLPVRVCPGYEETSAAPFPVS